jgi:hypothetical protein
LLAWRSACRWVNSFLSAAALVLTLSVFNASRVRFLGGMASSYNGGRGKEGRRKKKRKWVSAE